MRNSIFIKEEGDARLSIALLHYEKENMGSFR